MIRDTSLKSYLNEIAPTLGARQVAVLEVFEAHPDKDFTNAELSRALGWEINRVTPRVHELREKLHILEESRVRKCEATGRSAHAWQIAKFPAVRPKAVYVMPNRYQMPSLSQPGKTHHIVASAAAVTCGCKGFTFRGKCSHIEKLRQPIPGPGDMTASLFQ